MAAEPAAQRVGTPVTLRSELLRALRLFALVCVAYAVGSELSWHWFPGIAFFPPAGVTVATMLMTRRQVWPFVIAAIVLAEVAVDVQHAMTTLAAIGSAGANVVEPLVGALVTTWLCGGQPDLRQRADLAKFLAGACLLGPMAGALIGATLVSVGAGSWWLGVAAQWWAGDGIAVLVVGTPILLWPRQREMLSARRVELALLLVLTAGLSVAISLADLPAALLMLPVVAWAAIRLGDIAVVLAGTVFAFSANYLTSAGYGAFAHLGMQDTAARAVLQGYIAVVVLGLLMAQEVTARLGAVEGQRTARAERDRATARHAAAVVGAKIADSPSVAAVADLVVVAVRDRLGAEHAVINVLGDDKLRFVRLASTGLPPMVAAVAARFTVASDAPGPLALRQGSAVYRSDRQAARSEFSDKRMVEAAVGVRAVAAMPLRTETGALGYLDVWWTKRHEFTAAEREYLEAVAEIASRGMERARLRQAEQRERQQLQTLAELTRLLSAAVTPEDVGDIVSRQVRSDAGADGVALGMISDDGRQLEWVAVAGFPDQLRDWLGGLQLGDRTAVTDAARSGKPVIIGSLDQYRSVYPASAWHLARSGAASFVNWPLTVGEVTTGVLALMWTEPQALGDGQLAFASTVSGLVAQALGRARRFANEQAMAAILQEAVMPRATARIPGFKLGACYQPAGPGRGIGGDWYDAMPLPQGGIYLAVGDVLGHGLLAAEDMTQLRNAGRTLAIQGHEPGRLLAELSTVTGHATHGSFATMAIAILNPLDCSVTYGSAGHPPMLVRHGSDGSVTRLSRASGPALGADENASYTQGLTKLDRGDVLLMYTDGLVERRGEDIDDGIARVEEHLVELPDESSLNRLCRDLTAALAPRPHDDDVCVLAVAHGA